MLLPHFGKITDKLISMHYLPLLCILLSPLPSTSAEIIVATASDLAPAQQELAAAFQQSTGNSVRFVTGSSGMLARQVATGAPFDIFLSANRMYVDDLVEQGAIVKDSVRVYGKGRLGLWPLHSLEELRGASIKHIAIANPKHAPYGVAARQALETAGLWKAVEHKIVYGENVRQAMQYAESGNADAAITSWTLLQGRGTLLDEKLHEPIAQAGGIVATSKKRELAARFLRFLTDGEGVAVLRKFGLRQ